MYCLAPETHSATLQDEITHFTRIFYEKDHGLADLTHKCTYDGVHYTDFVAVKKSSGYLRPCRILHNVSQEKQQHFFDRKLALAVKHMFVFVLLFCHFSLKFFLILDGMFFQILIQYFFFLIGTFFPFTFWNISLL